MGKKQNESRQGRKKANSMHSFVSCLIHCVWATKERRPLIQADLQQRLWPYLGGVARESKMKASIVGGVEDTAKYNQGQAEHHREMSFKDELETFLKKHGMEYVEQDLE